MDNNFSLKNKLILVTGAAGLLGMQHCRAILQNEGIPILLDKNQNLLKKSKKQLKKSFDVEVDIFSLDFLSELKFN